MPPMVQVLPLAGSGSKPPAMSGEQLIEMLINNARLHSDPVRSNFEDLAKVNAQIDDDSGAERLRRRVRCRPRADQSKVLIGGVLDQKLQVFFVPGNGNGKRFNFKDAGIGGVEVS